MATLANPLYANGVPTYSNEVGALSSVFQALAPNPLRDLQIQGYANNARLTKLKGDVIQTQQGGLDQIAGALRSRNYQDVLPAAIGSGNLQYLGSIGKAVPAQFSFQALDPNTTFTPDMESRLATVVGGTGGNVANTMHGFTANQDRQTLEANQKNDTVMRGQDIRSADSRYGTDVGASTARRGQDIGMGNSTYATNMSFLKPTAGRAGTGAGGVGTNSTAGGSAASELNPKGVAELDSALANVLTGRVVPDADRADLAARTQAYYLAQPKGGRNFQLAANRAIADIQKGADLESSTDENWLSSDELMTKPAAERAPLPQPWQPPPKVSAAAGGGGGGLSALSQAVLQGNPNLRRPLNPDQLRAAQPAPVAAPVAAPAAAPTPAANPLVSEAAAAIASGAPRDAVIQRLRSMGVSDAEIQGI
jgi:hypothetical protein